MNYLQIFVPQDRSEKIGSPTRSSDGTVELRFGNSRANDLTQYSRSSVTAWWVFVAPVVRSPTLHGLSVHPSSLSSRNVAKTTHLPFKMPQTHPSLTAKTLQVEYVKSLRRYCRAYIVVRASNSTSTSSFSVRKPQLDVQFSGGSAPRLELTF